MARLEIVRTDAEQPFHVRVVASNGRTITSSENYAERSSALNGIAVLAETFGITMRRPPADNPDGDPVLTENTDPEIGERGLFGETPEGVVHLYPIHDVDEREAPE